MTDAARSRDAGRLGMMIFLASETMLFGALFATVLTMSLRFPEAIAAASARLDLGLGAVNTAVLLTSSLCVAIGVAARQSRTRARCLVVAAALGLVFLAIKAVEYAKDWREGLMPGTANAHFDGPTHQLFMNLYFIATGLHAVHLAVGIGLLGWLAWRLRRGPAPANGLVENGALYWHLVDVVWVFLYPVLYLTRQ